MKKVVVGVSGGADSMALLHWLINEGHEAVAVHVNYGKRQTAKRDQEAVEAFCQELKVPCHTFHYDEAIKGNFQQAAREYRYSTMIQIAMSSGSDCIAAAHHWHDDLETRILAESSGRKTRCLGLKEWSTVFGYPIWRPFVKKDKANILSYCKQHRITFYNDETNLLDLYQRNKVRKTLERLSQLEQKAIFLKSEAKQKTIDQFYEKVDLILSGVGNSFSARWYQTIDDVYREAVLRQWLINCGVTQSFSSAQLSRFDKEICKGTLNAQIGTKTLQSSYDQVLLYEPLSYAYCFDSIQDFEARHFKLQSHGLRIEGITLTEADFPIIVRSPKKGDEIALRFGRKALNRFFIDRKISHNLRHSWPLIENAMKDVIFVSGLGCDILHFSNNPSVFMLKL